MIPARHFRAVGKQLPIGEQTNINHDDCSAGTDTRKRLYVKRLSHCTVAYCHNCGEHGWHNSAKRRIVSVEELLSTIEQEEKAAGEVVLPSDLERNLAFWPAEAQAWLAKYEITPDEITNHSISYSPSWDRVILPVYRGGELVYWQGRALNGREPKYLAAKGGTKPLFSVLCHNATDSCFVVEDYLSAIKMGRHADAVALLGTSADINDLTDALSGYKNIGIVLDPDIAGLRKAHELTTRLTLTVPGEVRIFHPGETFLKQPKELDDSTLEYLANQLRGF